MRTASGASDSKRPSDDDLREIVEGKDIEPGGTNIPLIQAMAKELLELRAKTRDSSRASKEDARE